MNKLKLLKQSSVEQLMNKYEHEPSHAIQVAKLSQFIFKCTKEFLHNYGDKQLDLLRYASLLHDIGYYIEEDKHNKHSFDLILQSKMEGFIHEEIEIIAYIARCHRGNIDKIKQKVLTEVSNKETKKLIKILGSFLRIADGLDRSHTDAISKLDCIIDKEASNCTFILVPKTISCQAELFGANKKKDMFEYTFNMDAAFQVRFI